MNKAASTLNAAASLVAGSRNEDYGDILETHKRIVGMWNAYLKAKGHCGKLGAIDVPIMMALLKIAREAGKHKDDNFIDAAGYIGVAAEIESRERGE
tara:strand:- start:60 stop:350 length:291 start_codon:yes stop_codon:yes gene_type:complete